MGRYRMLEEAAATDTVDDLMTNLPKMPAIDVKET
jgi:hypothetical protein